MVERHRRGRGLDHPRRPGWPRQGQAHRPGSGDEEYRSEQALPQLARILAERHGFDCTVLFAINPKDGTIDPTRTDNIPGLEALDRAELMVLFTPLEFLRLRLDVNESSSFQRVHNTVRVPQSDAAAPLFVGRKRPRMRPWAAVALKGGAIAGVCEIVDCIGPLAAEVFRKNAAKAGMGPREARLGGYRNTYAGVLAKPRYLKKPVAYKHPSGAVIWVRLDGKIEQAIREQL